MKAKPESIINKVLNDKQKSLAKNPKNLNFSFEDFSADQKYASTFKDWQKIGLLSSAMETISGFCTAPISYDEKCTLYGEFPPETYTLFEHPAHVAVDARWVRIHVNGPAVIIGHLIENTFYVVFLDKTHKFWLTKRERERLFGKKALRPENKKK